jgi:hypothetical protein
MSDKVYVGNGCGTSFIGLLTILLVYLKLTGHIGWSWWWVWSPLWIGAIGYVVLFVLLVILIAFLDD